MHQVRLTRQAEGSAPRQLAVWVLAVACAACLRGAHLPVSCDGGGSSSSMAATPRHLRTAPLTATRQRRDTNPHCRRLRPSRLYVSACGGPMQILGRGWIRAGSGSSHCSSAGRGRRRRCSRPDPPPPPLPPDRTGAARRPCRPRVGGPPARGGPAAAGRARRNTAPRRRARHGMHYGSAPPGRPVRSGPVRRRGCVRLQQFVMEPAQWRCDTEATADTAGRLRRAGRRSVSGGGVACRPRLCENIRRRARDTRATSEAAMSDVSPAVVEGLPVPAAGGQTAGRRRDEGRETGSTRTGELVHRPVHSRSIQDRLRWH